MGWAAIIEAARRVHRCAFPRKPKPPLALAHQYTHDIVNLLYRYWFDKDYRPSEAELRSLVLLERRLFELHATGRRLIIRLERRFHGEPEVNEAKWGERER